jgi:nucleoside triphosphate diphosphatase
MKQRDMESIEKLLQIMAQLRDPTLGCPWDREQTFASIAPYTIEEAYEVADAIGRGALVELKGELGDLLFQVVFHARMAEEAGVFDFADVVDAICTKMQRRHPHVFGEAQVEDVAAQTRLWEEIKQAERAEQADGRGGMAEQRPSVLDDVPVALPGLSRAAKLGRRAATVGFDWPDAAGVRAKLDEELAEVDAATAGHEPAAVADELGDVLFTVANLCRHLDLDPEHCLRGANARFEARFRHVEAAVRAGRGEFSHYDPAELDRLWQAAKAAQRQG